MCNMVGGNHDKTSILGWCNALREVPKVGGTALVHPISSVGRNRDYNCVYIGGTVFVNQRIRVGGRYVKS